MSPVTDLPDFIRTNYEVIVLERKREHSRKPEALYDLIEACSPGPYLELFARHPRSGWQQWGNEAPETQVAVLEQLHKAVG